MKRVILIILACISVSLLRMFVMRYQLNLA